MTDRSRATIAAQLAATLDAIRTYQTTPEEEGEMTCGELCVSRDALEAELANVDARAEAAR